jgi:hypothetical protein
MAPLAAAMGARWPARNPGGLTETLAFWADERDAVADQRAASAGGPSQVGAGTGTGTATTPRCTDRQLGRSILRGGGFRRPHRRPAGAKWRRLAPGARPTGSAGGGAGAGGQGRAGDGAGKPD